MIVRQNERRVTVVLGPIIMCLSLGNVVAYLYRSIYDKRFIFLFAQVGLTTFSKNECVR